MTSLPLARNWAISKFLSRDEVERFRLVSHSRRALGEWLARGFVWHHVVTLTFALRQREENWLLRRSRHVRREPTEAGAFVQFRRWIRRLEQRAQRGVGWFVALERGAACRLHLHVLLAHTQDLNCSALVKAWPYGRADASPYDPSQGAPYYFTKDVSSDVVDFSHDIALHHLIRVNETSLG